MKSGSDGKWRKPGRGANEAFDLLVYADALAVLHGYEKIRWPSAPDWAQRETWLVFPQERSGETVSPELTAGQKNAVAGRKNCGRSVRKIIHG